MANHVLKTSDAMCGITCGKLLKMRFFNLWHWGISCFTSSRGAFNLRRAPRLYAFCGTFAPVSVHPVALLPKTCGILWHFFGQYLPQKQFKWNKKTPAAITQRADEFHEIGRCSRHHQYGFEVLAQSKPILTSFNGYYKSYLLIVGGSYGQAK